MTFGLVLLGETIGIAARWQTRPPARLSDDADFAQDGDDVILVDQSGDGRNRLLLLALVVVERHFHRATVDAAGRVSLFDGELDALVGTDAEGRLSAGLGPVLAD